MLQEDAPYQQSRSALRRIYGSRRIDASAPQAANDSTPSGRMRVMQADGLSPKQAREADTDNWRATFNHGDVLGDNGQRPIAQVRPFDLMRRRAAPQSPLDAIEQAHATGAVNGSFPTPFGEVGFDRPSLMPEAPVVENLSDYTGAIAATPPSSFFPKPRQPKRPSILDGADRWLT